MLFTYGYNFLLIYAFFKFMTKVSTARVASKITCSGQIPKQIVVYISVKLLWCNKATQVLHAVLSTNSLFATKKNRNTSSFVVIFVNSLII